MKKYSICILFLLVTIFNIVVAKDMTRTERIQLEEGFTNTTIKERIERGINKAEAFAKRENLSSEFKKTIICQQLGKHLNVIDLAIIGDIGQVRFSSASGDENGSIYVSFEKIDLDELANKLEHMEKTYCI